ncbi:leucine-rich repeat domain-containing protein [Candidatus Poriferisocius sp.]|uniref:leucine-rich repeat domain-containing protein n=1 Tax=Candidatus Poriferisocius sp. TaxID=3101276 RepID=UPI003B01977A
MVALSLAAPTAIAPSPAIAQNSSSADSPAQVRIAARKLTNGKIEFALQTAQPNNTWSNRLLPQTRYFPTNAPTGRWLTSSPLTLKTTTTRITARKLTNGKIEFALQTAQPNNTWSNRLLPQTRYFPTNAPTGRWLTSSPLTLKTTNPTTAREVLTKLYHSTNGDNWTNNQNWLTNKPLNTWHGITTNHKNKITHIYLPFNKLSGPIPKELGKLTNLELLSLWGNQLTGTIPTELSQLTNLTSLDLSFNQLTGTIPKKLGQLTNLTGLWLWSNQLKGTIPTELSQLTNLIYLDLSFNQLTGTIPKELGQLTNLEGLWLSNNELSGPIPKELGQLTNLEILSLWSNQLKGTIPKELGKLTNLTELWLEGNQITGPIPAELSQLTNLEVLFIDTR